MPLDPNSAGAELGVAALLTEETDAALRDLVTRPDLSATTRELAELELGYRALRAAGQLALEVPA